MNRETEVIHRIREFNRFYTVIFGMLNGKFHDSGYSVAENRILFELNAKDSCSANFLAGKLRMDKSYLSRILKTFEKRGLITKQVSPEDGRSFILRLTEQGRAETARLIEGADRQVKALIASLSEGECSELCAAMDVITDYLSGYAARAQEGQNHGV